MFLGINSTSNVILTIKVKNMLKSSRRRFENKPTHKKSLNFMFVRAPKHFKSGKQIVKRISQTQILSGSTQTLTSFQLFTVKSPKLIQVWALKQLKENLLPEEYISSVSIEAILPIKFSITR